MISASVIFALVIAVLNLFIGFYVWKNKKNNLSHRLFFILAGQLSLWVVLQSFLSFPISLMQKLTIVRLIMVCVASIPVTLYFFVTVFPSKRLTLSPWWKTTCLLWVGFYTIFNLLPFTFVDIAQTQTGLSLKTGWGINLLFVNLIFLLLAVISFNKNTKKATGSEKVRYNYLTLIFAVIINFIIFSSLFLFWKDNNYATLGLWLLTVFSSSTIGYSLLKNRLLSLDLILVKVFYYLSLFFWGAIALVFLLNVHLWAEKFTRVVAAIFLFLWSISFLYIYQNFQKFLIKKIVNQGLDWEKESLKFTNSLHNELDLQTIIDNTIRFISMLIKNNGNLVYANFSDEEEFSFTNSFIDKKAKPTALYELCLRIWSKKIKVQPLILEELTTINELHKALAKIMKIEGYVAIFPIKLYQGIKGILIMGEKENRDPYFIQDIKLIEKTLDELALTIDKALIYQSSKNLNQYLEKKISLATKKLVTFNKKLIAADKMKDEFVSIASHELRTPMTTIKNYLWLIRANNNEKKLKQNKKYLDIVIESTERLLDMVNDMLTTSRIEGDRFAINKEKIDLNQAVNHIYNDLLLSAEKKNLVLYKKNTPQPLWVMADYDKVLEVLNNLLGNAIKFTNQGKIRILCSRDEKNAIIKVVDSGPGIATEELPRIFKKFSRLEDSDYSYVKIKETGTGLGLYISHQIMTKHKGTISVKSQLKKGSTFTITFPLVKEEKVLLSEKK